MMGPGNKALAGEALAGALWGARGSVGVTV